MPYTLILALTIINTLKFKMPTDRAALPDPNKPEFPYVPNFRISIKAHKPPEPFDKDYRRDPQRRVTVNSLRKLSQSEYVSKTSLLESDTRESETALKPETASLSIIKPIAAQDSRGAQVVLCDVEPHNGSEKYQAVAKIYDALYYPFWHKSAREPSDVVYRADKDYTWEAAAYDHLDANVKCGKISVPRFFGSWTFTLPLEQSEETVERSVRLILIEYLDGVAMEELLVPNGGEFRDATHYQEGFRLEVLKTVLEVHMHLLNIGIHRSDLDASKVMLVPRPEPDSTPETPLRVVLIGYNRATVMGKTKYSEAIGSQKPTNPMYYYDSCQIYEFPGWVLLEWKDDIDKQRRWLEHRFGSKEMQAQYARPRYMEEAYESTEEDTLEEEGGPKWHDKVAVL